MQAAMSSSTPSNLAEGSSRRKVSHISRACVQCRRRKIRCDGAQPRCTPCAHVEYGCEYSTREDGRKAGAVQRSRAAQSRGAKETTTNEIQNLTKKNTLLRARILALERALSKRGVSVTEVLDESPDLLSADAPDLDWKEKGISMSESSGAEDAVTDFDRLHLDDMSSSTLCHYGPTSALNHLSAAGTSLLSPLSLDRQTQSSTLKEACREPSSLANQSAFPWLRPKLDVAWDRHLPHLGISLDTHDSLLELCEAFFLPWNWILNFPAFKRDLAFCLGPTTDSHPPPVRTPFYSPLLHNMILAMGACLWHGERIKRPFPPINQSVVVEGSANRDSADMAADTFHARARDCFDVECERPMQSLVNGLLLMASFNSGRARPNLGHVLFSCAVASSHALGINIDCTSFVTKGVITAETKAHRDHLFHTVYSQDKLWSMAIGRFTNITQDDHNIPWPDLKPADDEIPWTAPRVWKDIDANGLTLANGRPSFVSTCFRATIGLAMIQNSILRKFYSLKSDVRSLAQLGHVETLQKKLVEWHEMLPEAVRMDTTSVPPPHVMTLHITYQYTIMLLNRPLYQRLYHKDPNHSSVKACDAAALKVVELLGLYDHFYALNHAPLSSIQTTFVAGTIHLLKALESARRGDASHLGSALQGGAICIAALEKMGLSWRTGMRISRILQSLFNVWLPKSVAHMQEKGWLRLDSRTVSTPRSEDSWQGTPPTLDTLLAPVNYRHHDAATLQSLELSTSVPLGSTNLFDTSTTFLSQTQLEAPYSQVNTALTSANRTPSRVVTQAASLEATSQSSQQAHTPSSSDFLQQLLSHQQYQDRTAEYSDGPQNTYELFEQTFPSRAWAEASTTSDILSNFDFSIEAFNEMLKSTTTSQEDL